MPSIFTSFFHYKRDADIGLRLLTPLTSGSSPDAAHATAAVHCSVFLGHVPGIPGELRQNFVAKLVYRHYGVAVHQALHQAENQAAASNFAPELHGCSSKPGIQACVYIMEYLPPPFFGTPGWLTLDKINQDRVAKDLDLIYPLLNEIVDYLASRGLVHGDLRPNNLMIKMRDRLQILKPVEIKVVDFEWADRAGVARYPQSLGKDSGYPGEAGGLIGAGDDRYMINKWRTGILEYRDQLHTLEEVCSNGHSPF